MKLLIQNIILNVMNMKKKNSKCCFQATYDPETYNFNSDSTTKHNKLYYNRQNEWTGHGNDFDIDKKSIRKELREKYMKG